MTDPAPRLPHAVNGTEQRLDVLITDLAACRVALQSLGVAVESLAHPPVTVELREPAPPPAPPRRAASRKQDGA